MFERAELIDFGAGTGENTIYLANWGARCTLVEMNILSQDVSRTVFEKYAKRPDEHQFHLSSIFDFQPDPKPLYDIVHCRGVLSHTAAKETAFAKIATFLKPGGYLIFGDPNKAGGFQNMLQRYAVYNFAKTPDEMVDVCEILFKEDIDRSEQTIPRTRRAIIFDRWVIQSQDDPSISEVMSWCRAAGLQLYSAYPTILPSLMGDSLHHPVPLDQMSLEEFFPLTELTWMTQTVSDAENLAPVQDGLRNFAAGMNSITGYVANLNSSSTVNIEEFAALADDLRNSGTAIDPYANLREKVNVFLQESVDFVRIVQQGDLQDIRQFIENTQHLFRGACGNRHVDFIAYRPNETD